MGISPILLAAIRTDVKASRSAAERAALLRDMLGAMQAQLAMSSDGDSAGRPTSAEVEFVERLAAEVDAYALAIRAAGPNRTGHSLSALSARLKGDATA